MKDDEIKIHFISDDAVIHITTANYVPRVQEEIRLPINKYYKVDRVCWCYDEPYQRVNIGLVRCD